MPARLVSKYENKRTSRTKLMKCTLISFLTLKALLLAPLAGLRAAAESKAPAKPNIVINYADHLGYGDVGCNGATKVKTPNIDRLAAQGLRRGNCRRCWRRSGERRNHNRRLNK
jgi:hypothetical protein